MLAHTTKAEAGGVMPPVTVRVWDPLVRTLHWSLVALFAFAFVTADEWDSAHETAGYVISALVVVRIIWGLFGSRHARFSDFVRGPSTVARFLTDSVSLKAKRHLGHNPAGGAMILALLLSIGVIAITGFMMTTDTFWGVEWVEDAHELVVYCTLGLIALHVGGVIFASFNQNENLVKSMLTGRKRALDPSDVT